MLVASAMVAGTSPNDTDLLHNHAPPPPQPAPVYAGSRSQESAYQDYLAQFGQMKRDKDNPVTGSTLAKAEMPSHPSPKRSKPKKKPPPPPPPSTSMMYDYGYAEDMEQAHAKAFHSNGKHKYSNGHKVGLLLV